MKVAKMNKFARKEMEADRVNDGSTIAQAWRCDRSQNGDLNGSGKVFVSEGSNMQIASGNRVEGPRAVALIRINSCKKGKGKDGAIFECRSNLDNFCVIEKRRKAFLEGHGVRLGAGSFKRDSFIGLSLKIAV
jgi:hypothetical protein